MKGTWRDVLTLWVIWIKVEYRMWQFKRYLKEELKHGR
jgi:hypothetical protein